MSNLVALFFVLFLAGCVTGGYSTSDILPIAVPAYDESIRSVQYYEKENGYNCLEKKHHMQSEIDSARNAADLLNKFTSKIVIMGKTPHVNPDLRLYTKSKKLKENDYYIGCDCIPNIEVQVAEYGCWASCSQYLINQRFRKSILQSDIIAKIKPGVDFKSVGIAGDVIEIVRTLGFMGMKYTKGGSLHLLKAIAGNNPVMIGLLPDEKNSEPHAVVIIGARYSFAATAEPRCFQCGSVAFSEFVVLDPYDGSKKIVPASEYDGRIYFVLSYFVEE